MMSSNILYTDSDIMQIKHWEKVEKVQTPQCFYIYKYVIIAQYTNVIKPC